MARNSRIVELASLIQYHTLQVEDYISSQGLPSPSFDITMPAQLQFPEAIAESQNKVIEATDELHSLMLGPMGFLFHQIDSPHNLISLHAISRFDIASSFPIGEETTFAKIAQKCRLDEDETRRILRHAVTNHIFKEPRNGMIAHTAASKALVEVPQLLPWLCQACDDMWPATSRFVDAMKKWPGSEEPSQTAFNIATGAEDSYFVDMAKSPDRVKKFADAMSFFYKMPGFETSHVIEAFDWLSLADGLVVDVGGSHGAVALEMVKANPFIRVIVQDLPEVIDSARDAGKHNLSNRVIFEAHDFFKEQTLQGADVYFFRMIFHDWSDTYCVRILRSLIPTLKPGVKILINDFCLPSAGTISQYQERIARCHDLAMKALFNAKERDRNDWTNLLLKTDPRFQIVKINEQASSPLALIEISWNETVRC